MDRFRIVLESSHARTASESQREFQGPGFRRRSDSPSHSELASSFTTRRASAIGIVDAFEQNILEELDFSQVPQRIGCGKHRSDRIRVILAIVNRHQASGACIFIRRRIQ